jgi:hypothetical protein
MALDRKPTAPIDAKFYGFRYRPTDETARRLRAISLTCEISANELICKLVDYALKHARITERMLTVRDLAFDDELRVLEVNENGEVVEV